MADNTIIDFLFIILIIIRLYNILLIVYWGIIYGLHAEIDTKPNIQTTI